MKNLDIESGGKPRIGLALGGGGVRGLAHIPVLELLDELGLRPCAIAGTSMGAVMGALYASGISGKAIRELVDVYTINKGESLRDLIEKRSTLFRWVTALAPEWRRGGLINVDRFLNLLFEGIADKEFSDLDIPLTVVAADFWAAEEVVIRSGKLLPAIRASMAVPGVFAPVTIDGRVLVDGGLVNQVPYDLLVEQTDLVIALDVNGEGAPGKPEIPHTIDSILGAFDIMQAAALERKLVLDAPQIIIRPRIRNVNVLDFSRIADVFLQAAPAVELLRAELDQINF